MGALRVGALEVEERTHQALDALDVGGGLVLAFEHPLGGGARVADEAGRAADETDDPMPRSLQAAQHDELDEVAEVQRRRCRVEAAIGRDRAAREGSE